MSRGLAQQIDAGRQAVWSLINLGMVHREIEDFHGAWQADREAIDLARTGEVGVHWMPIVCSSYALDAAALGRLDDAEAYIEEAQRALAEGPNRADFLQEVTHAEGRVLLALGRTAEARDTATILSEMVAATGTLHWRVSALLLRADATLALGDAEGAAPAYAAAAEEAERQGRPPALWRALAGLAEMQRMLGQVQESVASAGRAREIIERLAASVPDERLRAAFLQSTKVQRVVTLAGPDSLGFLEKTRTD